MNIHHYFFFLLLVQDSLQDHGPSRLFYKQCLAPFYQSQSLFCYTHYLMSVDCQIIQTLFPHFVSKIFHFFLSNSILYVSIFIKTFSSFPRSVTFSTSSYRNTSMSIQVSSSSVGLNSSVFPALSSSWRPYIRSSYD